jgi:hypothetical protein
VHWTDDDPEAAAEQQKYRANRSTNGFDHEPLASMSTTRATFPTRTSRPASGCSALPSAKNSPHRW